MARVDLNADLGEGAGDDEAMLALVTSANVACGFHAGDAATMRATCAAAAGARRGDRSAGRATATARVRPA